jgi:carbon storage regulator
MLVIRRRAGESFLIGEGVEIEILELAHSQVKLGIRAPREVTILRKEVALTREQNRTAAASVPANCVQRLLSNIRTPGR